MNLTLGITVESLAGKESRRPQEKRHSISRHFIFPTDFRMPFSLSLLNIQAFLYEALDSLMSGPIESAQSQGAISLNLF